MSFRQETAGGSVDRQALAELLEKPLSELSGKCAMSAFSLTSPLGSMLAVSDPKQLHLLEFYDRNVLRRELRRLDRSTPNGVGFGRTALSDPLEEALQRYFLGRSATFSIPLAFHGTPFQQQVWRELVNVPAGKTVSYGELAEAIGRPKASRAVAQANGANQIAILVPCHRVIGADGTLTGYGGGLWRKQRLLDIEKCYGDLSPSPPTR